MDEYGFRHDLRKPEEDGQGHENEVRVGGLYWKVGRAKDCDFQIRVPERSALSEVITKKLAERGDKTIEINPDKEYENLINVYGSISRYHAKIERPNPYEPSEQHAIKRKFVCLVDRVRYSKEGEEIIQITEVGGRQLEKDEMVIITGGTTIKLGGLSMVFCMGGTGDYLPKNAPVIRLPR